MSVFASTAPGNTAQWLVPTPSGNKPKKQGWIKTLTEIAKAAGLKMHWENGALKHTGRSARPSGACHLAAAGVDLWRINIFGRWSSAACLKYVRSSPLVNMASESAIASSITAAKLGLRALTSTSAQFFRRPIPVSGEMLQERAPEPVPASSQQ